MGRYRKKPVEIDAVEFTGANHLQIMLTWTREVSVHAAEMRTDRHDLVISTLEGEMRANPGDWIICGVQGEFYPCKPDIFAATYEPV